MRRKILIVDGYNVVRATPPYKELADLDLSAARDALIADVAAYAAGEWEATVVFDGGGNPLSTGQGEDIHGVRVVFSKYGTSADSVVEMLARRAREREDQVDVVTSDAQTQWTVMGSTVARRSSAEFSRELRAEEAEWREASGAGRAVVRLEDRIDPEVRDRLREMIDPSF